MSTQRTNTQRILAAIVLGGCVLTAGGLGALWLMAPLAGAVVTMLLGLAVVVAGTRALTRAGR